MRISLWKFWTRKDSVQLLSHVWLFEIPWTAGRSNQSILKEISPEYSLEGLMLKLKLQYFGHLMRRTNSLEKTWCWEGLRAGGEGDHRGLNHWTASLTRWDMSLSNLWELVMDRESGMLQSMGSQRVRHDWVTELNPF